MKLESSMSHTCSTAIVHCIDFRLGSAIKNFLEERELLDDCDIISLAGATKDMTVPLAQIEISKKLHNIQKVILMNHTDCGAYGGRSAFPSENDENEAHLLSMRRAKDAILAKYPDLEVEIALAKIEKDQGVRFLVDQ